MTSATATPPSPLCGTALAKPEPTLAQVAVDRAVNGVAEPVFHAGQVVGHRTKFSDGLLRDAIRREDARMGVHKTKSDLVKEARAAAKLAGGQFYTDKGTEETIQSLLDKLGKIERGYRRECAETAKELLDAGLVP